MFRRRAGLTVQFGAMALVALCGTAARGEGIEYFESLEAARAVDAERPVVLSFTASWCSWCRRMEQETLPDPAVAALADRLLWVKVDIDRQPELAALFSVTGVPHTAVLDADDALLAARPGFLEPAELAALLLEALDRPAAERTLEELLLADTDPAATETPADRAARLVELLARPARAGRRATLAALEQLGREAWPTLVELLSDDRLAVRAAAAAALRQATAHDLPFAPFDPPATRREQAAAWGAWVAESNSAAPAPPAAEADSGGAATVAN
jgi:thioredoxin-like negative regulator of GroEL